ncbi:uncharacterized protein IUM83_11419 [Phytophthora cinnamomi]|uniref:uncharacterized protein n=1 Tax=Phytophthora cinnamomi TaxID=4785 RepID=UPI002A33488B|nr:hypothetical protein IUM83_11419 [Phytophthora cinnamomi]KAJ8523812.1 hypothetical protein ON010_g17306 [Phytophthora cinnamomi]
MISPEVMQELLAVRQVLHYLPESQSTEKGWTPHEQQLFWIALTTYPQGPWTAIAEYIGTKTTRQAMTHAQKLRQKLKRWNTRLRSNPDVSSLMDAVSVSSDGNVTVSASASHDVPPTSASYPMAPTPPHPNSTGLDDRIGEGEHECKGREQHSSYTAAVGIGGALPPHYQVPLMIGLRQHAQHAALVRTTSPQTTVHDELHATIPHDFLDELVKALSSEDADDEEVTEEELQELDDGDTDSNPTK